MIGNDSEDYVINFDDYQTWSNSTAIYPKDRALEYTALGLASEAGEVAGKIKKLIRDGDTYEGREAAIGELGDVLWYLARVSEELGVNLSEIALSNQAKLNSRKSRGVIGGSGDNR